VVDKNATTRLEVMDIGMAAMLILGLTAVANGMHEVYILNLSEKDQSTFLSLHAGFAWTIMTIYLWKLVVRQKKKSTTIKSIELSKLKSHNYTFQE
jgi:uncharacterized membrane-anchored protein